MDRLYATLKERGIQAERNYLVRDAAVAYEVLLSVPCRDGRIDLPAADVPQSDQDVLALADQIEGKAQALGGIV